MIPVPICDPYSKGSCYCCAMCTPCSWWDAWPFMLWIFPLQEADGRTVRVCWEKEMDFHIQLPGEPEGPNSKGCFGQFQEKNPLTVHCDLRLPIHGTNFCDPWIKLCPGIFSQVSVQALWLFYYGPATFESVACNLLSQCCNPAGLRRQPAAPLVQPCKPCQPVINYLRSHSEPKKTAGTIWKRSTERKSQNETEVEGDPQACVKLREGREAEWVAGLGCVMLSPGVPWEGWWLRKEGAGHGDTYLNEILLALCWLDWALTLHVGQCVSAPQCCPHPRILWISLPGSLLPLPAQYLCTISPISSVTLHQWLEGLGKPIMDLHTRPEIWGRKRPANSREKV